MRIILSAAVRPADYDLLGKELNMGNCQMDEYIFSISNFSKYDIRIRSLTLYSC